MSSSPASGHQDSPPWPEPRVVVADLGFHGGGWDRDVTGAPVIVLDSSLSDGERRHTELLARLDIRRAERENGTP
ncbi:MAG TPA: hypothetical protein VFW65_31875 [Pseudonocardiaceae bacterium]|nr:hypothetical protein [Pseudonocardiaceae bacterium]